MRRHTAIQTPTTGIRSAGETIWLVWRAPNLRPVFLLSLFMTEPRHKLLLCNCNRTVPIDGKVIASALGLPAQPHMHSELCRKHVAAFEAAVRSGEDIIVACTQEAPLFQE